MRVVLKCLLGYFLHQSSVPHSSLLVIQDNEWQQLVHLPPHCHTFKVLSTDPVTRVRPLRSKVVTKWEWAFSIFLTHLPFERSHTRTLLSSLPLMRYLPPPMKTKSFTQLSWPTSVMRQRPLLASQILIVLSRDPDAKYSRPSSSSYPPTFFSSITATDPFDDGWGSSTAPAAPPATYSSFFFSLASFFAWSAFFIYWIRSAVVRF